LVNFPLPFKITKGPSLFITLNFMVPDGPSDWLGVTVASPIIWCTSPPFVMAPFSFAVPGQK